VINFLGFDCQLKHITIHLFESLETSRQVLAKKLSCIVRWIWIKDNNIAYVKDEGANFSLMIVTQKFVVSCEVLGLDESF
jgi:hypothetical protein